MHLLTLVFGFVLLPKASTLKCYSCDKEGSAACTQSAAECPSQCGSLRLTEYTGGSKITSDTAMKGCVTDDQCGDVSINFGVVKKVISTACCSTDLCNNKTAPAPTKTGPNGRKCFYCNGQTCTPTLNCEGNEDHCVSTTVTEGEKVTLMKGCASKLLCNNEEAAKRINGKEVSCCQGDFCNGASGTSAAVLLLAAPLLSLVHFF